MTKEQDTDDIQTTFSSKETCIIALAEACTPHGFF